MVALLELHRPGFDVLIKEIKDLRGLVGEHGDRGLSYDRIARAGMYVSMLGLELQGADEEISSYGWDLLDSVEGPVE